MIQRIQSVYLFVAAALTCCLFGLPYASIGNKILTFNVTVFHLSPAVPGMQASTMLPLTAITICAALLCVITIFLFGNRTRQIKIVRLNIMLQIVVLLGMAAYCVGLQHSIGMGTSFSPRFASAIPVVNIILLVMAYKGIKADDDLVKSADRLR